VGGVKKKQKRVAGQKKEVIQQEKRNQSRKITHQYPTKEPKKL